ncbi:hypothetical protein A6A06_14670 [Streptomyces sp. CB02923]|nr:hypothetical protein A6A06_14670 [Streptomyces sp. CB02923]
MTLLDLVADAREPASLSDLARGAGLPKSTTHRLLLGLREHGLVRRDGRGYQLGARLAAADPLPACVQHLLHPYLVQLHHMTGLVVVLGVLRQDQCVILDAVFRPGQEQMSPVRGERSPAHHTALGVVSLAYRASDTSPSDITHDQRRKVAETGAASQRMRGRSGLAEFAVPIFSGNRRPLAACGLIHRSNRPLDHPQRVALHATARRAALAVRAQSAEYRG